MNKWKIFVLVVMSVLGFACTSNADTISFWHVYYNKIKIGDFNIYTAKPGVSFKTDSIKANDSLTVQYFDDTPCSCTVTLLVQDQNGQNILVKNAKGTWTAITFSLHDLIEITRQSRQDDFTVYFIEGELGESRPMIPLFTIHLE